MSLVWNQRGEFRPRRAFGLTIATLLLVITPVALAARWSDTPGADVPGLAVTTAGATTAPNPNTGVLVAQGGTGGEPVSAEDALTPTRSADNGPRRIKYLVGDGWVPIDNGGTVPLGDGLEVTVTLTPYPPTEFDCATDFLLTQNGEPVTNAEISLVYDMFIMGHGPFTTPVENLGGGRYRTDHDFFMYGPWELIPTVRIPGNPTTEFTLSVYIWPN